MILSNGCLVKASVKVLSFHHIDDDMGILRTHQLNDFRCLIGGYHCVQQIHLLMTVAAHCLYAGDPMTIFLHIGLHHLFRLPGGDLQGHSLIPVMERGDRSGGNKLEQNRISCINPSEHKTENTQKNYIPSKYLFPD